MRRVLGREAVGLLRTAEARVESVVVTVRRQFTTVPKTSVRSAFGGSERIEEGDMVMGWELKVLRNGQSTFLVLLGCSLSRSSWIASCRRNARCRKFDSDDLD